MLAIIQLFRFTMTFRISVKSTISKSVNRSPFGNLDPDFLKKPLPSLEMITVPAVAINHRMSRA